jgi:glycosyltransferase involved in cell wall biosynthesis
MRIAIDARLINETGVGRYIRNLIQYLGDVDSTNEYVVFLRKKTFNTFTCPNNRWKKRIAEVSWHSFAEQLVMPLLFLRANVDLVHIPYFNAPIFYPGRYILTIHDLIVLSVNTGKASTLPPVLYAIRRIGYNIVLRVGVYRASHIICVSHTTEKEVVDRLGVQKTKITTIYEGIDNNLRMSDAEKTPTDIRGEYLLVVGNAYPHKNLLFLIEAFQKLKDRSEFGSMKLVFVGREDFFYRRIKKYVQGQHLDDFVTFLPTVSDSQLTALYTHARVYVSPSLIEGFGLPAIEALSIGCPVCVSDIPVYHEILGDLATYFNPVNQSELLVTLTATVIASTPGRRSQLKDLAAKRFAQFDWKLMAQKTKKVYEH